jgi:hypothetical protein
MKQPWFKRNGIFFIPTSFMGWVILLCALAYAVYTIIELNNSSHSVSDFVRNSVFSLLLIDAIYSLVAYLTIRISKLF